MTVFNATSGVADNQNSLQQTEHESASQNIEIQHSYNNSAVVSANFFRQAPVELIYMIGAYLLPSYPDLYNLSVCNKPLYAMLYSRSGPLEELARERFPEVLTMLPNRGFRPFTNEQMENIKFVHFHLNLSDQNSVNALLQNTAQGLQQAAAALKLHAGGSAGKFEYALRNIDQWPKSTTKLFGRDDFNLKHMAWRALAAELASTDGIDCGVKATMFDKILGVDPQATHSALAMLDNLGPLGRLSDREKFQLLDSFCKENNRRPPCLSFTGLLSLVPVMEIHGPRHRPDYEFSSRYVFNEMCVQAHTLGPGYETSLNTIIGANRSLRLLLTA